MTSETARRRRMGRAPTGEKRETGGAAAAHARDEHAGLGLERPQDLRDLGRQRYGGSGEIVAPGREKPSKRRGVGRRRTEPSRLVEGAGTPLEHGRRGEGAA